MKQSNILAIETSCDETGVSITRCTQKKDGYQCEIITNLLHSQIKLHRKTGGIVPEVAAREHAVRLPLLLERLSQEIPKSKLKKMIDAIAVTNGPGLVTSLLVGVEIARTISWAWKKPLVPVNHLEGHIYTNLLTANSQYQITNGKYLKFKFPLLALIVSGGHTELVLMQDNLKYKVIGSTCDDAAGEAFDKTAKLLGLPYPGGPELAKLAKNGNPHKIEFPRPMLNHPNLDFSFAGLKTSVAVYLQKNKHVKKADVAAGFQEAAIDTLISKTSRAAVKHKPKTVLLAGGVAANLALRKRLEETFTARHPNVNIIKPSLKYTTDNAAMISAAGGVRYLNGYSIAWDKIKVDPNAPLK